MCQTPPPHSKLIKSGTLVGDRVGSVCLRLARAENGPFDQLTFGSGPTHCQVGIAHRVGGVEVGVLGAGLGVVLVVPVNFLVAGVVQVGRQLEFAGHLEGKIVFRVQIQRRSLST